MAPSMFFRDQHPELMSVCLRTQLGGHRATITIDESRRAQKQNMQRQTIVANQSLRTSTECKENESGFIRDRTRNILMNPCGGAHRSGIIAQLGGNDRK